MENAIRNLHLARDQIQLRGNSVRDSKREWTLCNPVFSHPYQALTHRLYITAHAAQLRGRGLAAIFLCLEGVMCVWVAAGRQSHQPPLLQDVDGGKGQGGGGAALSRWAECVLVFRCTIARVRVGFLHDTAPPEAASRHRWRCRLWAELGWAWHWARKKGRRSGLLNFHRLLSQRAQPFSPLAFSFQPADQAGTNHKPKAERCCAARLPEPFPDAPPSSALTDSSSFSLRIFSLNFSFLFFLSRYPADFRHHALAQLLISGHTPSIHLTSRCLNSSGSSARQLATVESYADCPSSPEQIQDISHITERHSVGCRPHPSSAPPAWLLS